MDMLRQNDYSVTICFKTYITKKVKAISEVSAIQIAENQIDAMTDEEYSKVIVDNLSRGSATAIQITQ